MLTRPRSTLWCHLLVTLCVVLKALSLTPFEVCSDFEPTPNSPPVTWGLLDCIEVWKKWGATIDESLHEGYPDREILQDMSAVLRRRGSPCSVREEKTLDGTGSSVMRHVAAWLYAKEVGCDWTTPDFNQGDVRTLLDPSNLEKDEILYCHRTEFVFKFNVSIPLKEGKEARRCASVSWLHYFNLNQHSVPPPDGGVVKVVTPDPWNATTIQTLVNETQLAGLENVPWDRLQISFEPQVAAQYAANVGSWDATKREHTRELLGDLRREFHKYPRPGYTSPICPYDSSTLSFAIHIRLGDRGSGQHAITEEYRKRLDKFMDTVTKEVVSQGQPTPLFHIFSQTKEECPSEETGTFAEFPKWPLEPDEIRACIDAEPPEDCPEKQAGGAFCYPERSGVFHVRGSPVVLNLDPDVVNTLGCMIKADGILMGCSAFGELAGVLSEGMKLFSVGCGGPMTWEQNQLSPPLAIAERGELWVPIAGSWRNPGIGSMHIFRQVLRQYLIKKNGPLVKDAV